MQGEPIDIATWYAPLSPDLEPVPVWTAPPGWPQPPAGWTPEEHWQPDPSWPSAPTVWEFAVIPEEYPAQLTAAEVATPADQLYRLNLLEHALQRHAQDDWKQQHAADTVDATSVSASHPAGRLRRRHRGTANQPPTQATVALALRDHLVYALGHQQELDPGYFEWRSALDATWQPLHLARVNWHFQTAIAAMGRVVDGLEEHYAASAVDTAAVAALPLAVQWRRAEELAAETLREFGFDDARRTPQGSDGGLDVVGAKVAAQVKWVAKTIGRPTLQQLLGAAGDRLTAFFARGGYTAQAFEFAESCEMALFLIALPGKVTPVTSAAVAMCTTAEKADG